MEHKLSHRSERGTWAPFVGVALAALTVGSLVLFSVIAQRTAGGAFVSNGLAVESPSQQAARSITLATGSGGGGSAVASERTAIEVADVAPSSPPDLLLADPGAAPDAAIVTAVDAVDDGSDPDSDADTDPTVAISDDLTPFFRMAAGGPANGQVFAASNGKKANGEGNVKDAKGSKKSKKAKNAARRKSRGHARNDDGSRGHGPRARGGSGSARAAAPAPRSRPAAASRPAPRAKPAPNHTNRRGNGHSKGRGHGHRH